MRGGNSFVLVNPDTQERGPAFDHHRLAGSLADLISDTITVVTLPFDRFEFTEGEDAIDFVLARGRRLSGPLVTARVLS